MRRLFLVLFSLLVSAPAQAQNIGDLDQRTRDAVAVMSGEMPMEEAFAPSFETSDPVEAIKYPGFTKRLILSNNTFQVDGVWPDLEKVEARMCNSCPNLAAERLQIVW